MMFHFVPPWHIIPLDLAQKNLLPSANGSVPNHSWFSRQKRQTIAIPIFRQISSQIRSFGHVFQRQQMCAMCFLSLSVSQCFKLEIFFGGIKPDKPVQKWKTHNEVRVWYIYLHHLVESYEKCKYTIHRESGTYLKKTPTINHHW